MTSTPQFPGFVAGLDGGLNGALAVLETTTGHCVYRMTWLTREEKRKGGGNVTVYNNRDMWDMISPWADTTLFFLERAQAMPGQGVVSMFSTGYGYGLLRMALAASGARKRIIRATEWQKEILPPRKKGKVEKGKKASRNGFKVCQKLWPGLDLRDPRKPKARVPHDGICDALLIAEVGRRWVIGKNLCTGCGTEHTGGWDHCPENGGWV